MGEIEAALRAQPGVDEALVTIREHDQLGKQLIGYIVPASGTSVDVSGLRQKLRQTLPEYMVPSTILAVAAWPLTSNGKIDRKALPDPAIADRSAEDTFAAPQSEMERDIATIWKKVLGLETISIFSNFFDLGGHSLLAVQVHSALKEIARQQVSLTDLFKYPTIASLATYMTGDNNGVQTSAAKDDELEKLKRGKARQEQRLRKNRGAA